MESQRGAETLLSEPVLGQLDSRRSGEQNSAEEDSRKERLRNLGLGVAVAGERSDLVPNAPVTKHKSKEN